MIDHLIKHDTTINCFRCRWWWRGCWPTTTALYTIQFSNNLLNTKNIYALNFKKMLQSIIYKEQTYLTFSCTQ